ncbi:glycine--tRNA ligase subunit beta, partial [candidate division WOR-3 bacterium]|nr:glycine--tRNA ligase subunit beta [candidate division WOR-3 bacterium]
MNKDFLLEIGTEEIPAPYLEPAINSLTRLLSNCLRDKLIHLGKIMSFYTPRRLSVFIEEVSPKAEDIVNMITGPPKEVSFKDGNPAPPLIGFV